ncbi:MAG: RNA polymerase sigma factor RpoD/SigA [candidate division NC10 bacterium]|nr:RNA polymerase sigma factor RpoD/SigA [candidate division NC10 bacterium]
MSRRSAFFYEEITDDAMAAYLRQVLQIPMLSKEEELRLGELIQQKGDEKALKSLVEANLRFVIKVAMRYQGCGLSLLDLINEGNLGLLEAARRYSPAYGVKFITYAVWWIRQAIMQALATSGGAVRLPLRKARLASQLRGRQAELSQILQTEAGGAELAEELDLTQEEVLHVLRAATPGSSLDESPEGGDRPRPLEFLQSSELPPADSELIKKSFQAEVARMLQSLKPRERAVIEMRFGILNGEPLTLEKIGRKLKLSRERVRQIEDRAKKQLRLMAKLRQLRDYLN